jgi:hypothetical protein
MDGKQSIHPRLERLNGRAADGLGMVSPADMHTDDSSPGKGGNMRVDFRKQIGAGAKNRFQRLATHGQTVDRGWRMEIASREQKNRFVSPMEDLWDNTSTGAFIALVPIAYSGAAESDSLEQVGDFRVPAPTRCCKKNIVET